MAKGLKGYGPNSRGASFSTRSGGKKGGKQNRSTRPMGSVKHPMGKPRKDHA